MLALGDSVTERPRPLIRELTPADRNALAFVFDHLGLTSRYQRFMGAKKELTARELDYLTMVDHWHREALIAFRPLPRTPIGIARYERCEEFDCAEVAIEIIDGWQRRGVGAELLLSLGERAVRRGIRRFTATTLAGNRGALALARQFRLEPIARLPDGVIELEGRPTSCRRTGSRRSPPWCRSG
jgi:RimJ/RimL family protein N-acetyltransferase